MSRTRDWSPVKGGPRDALSRQWEALSPPNSVRGIGGGGAAAYTPASDSTFRLFYPVSSLTDGAVASMPELRGGYSAAQITGTKQPAKSGTSLGGFPGVTYDGGDVLVAAGAGAAISDLSAVTIFLPAKDANATTSLVVELTADATANDGSLFIATNNGGPARQSVGCRGGTGTTSKRATNDLSAVTMITAGLDVSIAGAGAVVWMEFDGVDQALTNITVASTAGLFAAADLFFGGRGATPTVAFTGTMGAFGVRAGTARDAGYDQALTWWGTTCGKVL